jgi:hypothetical protein
MGGNHPEFDGGLKGKKASRGHSIRKEIVGGAWTNPVRRG